MTMVDVYLEMCFLESNRYVLIFDSGFGGQTIAATNEYVSLQAGEEQSRPLQQENSQAGGCEEENSVWGDLQTTQS